MKKLLVIGSLFLASLNQISAQIEIYCVKDKDYSSIAYEVSINYNSLEAKKQLEARGYDPKKISSQPGTIDTSGAKTGYYVVIRSSRDLGDNKQKISYGIGASKSSYIQAEKEAVKNIAAFDWDWKPKYNYEIIEKNTFDVNAPRQSLILITFMSKDATGNKTVKNLKYQYKSLTDKEYKQFKSRYASDIDGKEVIISRILVNNGKAAVLKCIKTNSENILTENIILTHTKTGDYPITLAPFGTTTNAKESNKYFIVGEIDLNQPNPGFYDNLKKTVIELFSTNENKSEKKGDGASGVRD